VLLLILCAFLVLGNALMFYALQSQNQIRPAIPIPFSLGVLFVLAILLRWLLLARPQLRWSRKTWTAACTTAALLSIAFPLAQMYCFGKTDYRRHADVIVVFGCRAYADGRPSDALADRVRTACELYHQGYAPTLLFTGGPGDGTIHETESMRRLAISLGVPQASILCDNQGLSTSASIDSTQRMLHAISARRVLVVSHFYHLPRIKLAYQRVGRDVYTVPAQERYTLRQLPYNMAREVAALWAYYLRLA
jgi:vancomycin permeability regulator SanA